MSLTFTVTYDVTTPESAEDGDVAESGFYVRGGWRFPATDDTARGQWDLREVVSEYGQSFTDNGNGSFYREYNEPDYRTGEETSYAVHIHSTVTDSTRRRIARILTGKR